MKIAIIGASGRMGKAILSVLPEFPDVSVAALVVSPHSESLEQYAELPNGGRLTFTSDIEGAVRRSSCVVDFSSHVVTLPLARLCAEHSRPLLLAATGHSSGELEEVASLSKSFPLLLASNTAVGVYVLRKLATRAASLLSADADIEIVETHHRYKKDSPSGTALTIAQDLERARSEMLSTSPTISCGRSASQAASRVPGEITIHSLRGGTVAGDHEVHFFGMDERITLSLQVTDRKVYARGALQLASLLVSMPAGSWTIDDLYERKQPELRSAE